MEGQAKFDGWAVMELMGRNREIGYVTTEYYGTLAMFRIDQPELEAREFTLKRPEWIGEKHCPKGTVVRREAMPGKTVLVAPASIFRLTPCTEETVRQALEELLPAPIKILSIPKDTRRLAERLAPAESDEDGFPEF